MKIRILKKGKTWSVEVDGKEKTKGQKDLRACHSFIRENRASWS